MSATISSDNYIFNMAKSAKDASVALRAASTLQKNRVLEKLITLLNENRDQIKKENQRDLEEARKMDLSEAMIDRLVLNDKGVDSIITSLQEIIHLKDPVGEVISGGVLPNGLHSVKVRVPIGVIAIIYESRPNVTIDVGALGLKSSNAVILRGGKEALYSNTILAKFFQQALQAEGLPLNALQLVEKSDRSLLLELLKRNKEIDLIVPRGGEGLISFVSEHSLIPVVKHDKGVCHVYIDRDATKEIALAVTINSKVQRPGVCNAAETLLLDEKLAFSTDILQHLQQNRVNLRADKETKDFFKEISFMDLTEEGYEKEYLSLDISVKVVRGLEGAISHIERYSSGHSEAIISDNYTTVDKFLERVDSAALFVNASTRFHDGGQLGLGAEVGISTGKLHCRGPMGLSDLTTTKYIVTGRGQIRT